MKTILQHYNTNDTIGELMLNTQPRNGEYVEFEGNIFSIHRIIHTERGLKLMISEIR